MSDNGIYNGTSESVNYIVDCYVDYAQEVIAKRAFPDLRDGLKTVQRRILYGTSLVKKNYLQKCATVISKSMEIHPHGDGSVWGAFCLMTDENGSLNMPLFHADGNLGHVWSSDPPAAFRYPQYMLNENADDFFKDKEVIELIPSEEGEGNEVTVFPVNYPVVLVNGADGIAVSVATKMPSFNFGDVIDLTVKYLENGNLEVTDMIVPDFPTGGVLVQDDAEIAKIMAVGKGKLKVRAKVEVQGKDIIVKEVPCGKTVESILRAIDKAEIREILKAVDIHGRNSIGKIRVECRSKKAVDYVLMELYRRNILQNIFASNITVSENGEPFIIGVHDVIRRWCNWRRSILVKKFNIILGNIANELPIYDYFVRLVSNEEHKMTYVEKAARSGKNVATEYLKELFPDIPEDVCNWISGRSLPSFHKGGKYIEKYNTLLESKKFYEDSLSNPDRYIIDELEGLKVAKLGKYDRKTMVTHTDYKFSKVTDSTVIEDTSYCVWTLFCNGFLKKSRNWHNDSDVLCQFEGQANDILIGFDNFGRILRIPGNNIEFTGVSDNGVYMPKYFDVTFQKDYMVLYLGKLDGTKRMLVYKDGYVGFLDTSEWVGKKVLREISYGVSTFVYGKLLEVYEESEIPQCLLVAEEENDVVRLGLVNTDSIQEKGRKARTKVFYGDNPNIEYLKGFDYMSLIKYIPNPEQYLGKLKVMKDDFYGDPTEMVSGRYWDICKDAVE